MNMSNERKVSLSKSLSWLLRHGAVKKGLKIHQGGYVEVDQVLRQPEFAGCTTTDLEAIVTENQKQRFSLKSEGATLFIRANQGHSIPVEDAELLEEITDPEKFPIVIHGTYKRFWGHIKVEGLRRMKRNHIHFAPGEPGSVGVISGMRGNVEIYIYIKMADAIKDGIKFYRSANNVVLSPGNAEGVLEPKYFKNILDVRTNLSLTY